MLLEWQRLGLQAAIVVLLPMEVLCEEKQRKKKKRLHRKEKKWLDVCRAIITICLYKLYEEAATSDRRETRP